MRRVWPLGLTMLITACGSAPPQLSGPRMDHPYAANSGPGWADQGMPMGSMGSMGSMRPMGSMGMMGQPPRFGTLAGGMGQGLGRPLGGGQLFGEMGGIDQMLSHSGSLSAEEPALGDQPDLRALPSHREGEAFHGLMISSHVRCNPEDIRIKASHADGDMTLSTVVPVQGKVKLRHLKSDKERHWETEGAASFRMHLGIVDEEAMVAKPLGMSPITAQTTQAPSFAISQLTIEAEGHPVWTITDPTAIIAYKDMPNIAPGTKVTVSVTLSGDSGNAIPFLITASDDDGKIMHLWAQEGEDATFSRTFTAHQVGHTFGAAKLKVNMGFIGVKILDKAALKAGDGLRATAMLLKFPSDKEGPVSGYQDLAISPALKRHVQTVLQTIDAAEAKHPSISGADMMDLAIDED